MMDNFATKRHSLYNITEVYLSDDDMSQSAAGRIELHHDQELMDINFSFSDRSLTPEYAMNFSRLIAYSAGLLQEQGS